jgi:hypothetical protein
MIEMQKIITLNLKGIVAGEIELARTGLFSGYLALHGVFL